LGVIRDLEVGFGPRLASAGGAINVETELPPVRCKRFDLGTVFQKLIDNALTYNKSEEKEVAIGFLARVQLEGEELNDVFYVRDNGIGISLEYHEEVFRMFKRLHHDEDYGPGAGAGLSFVKKVVANYGGFVRLVSAPGEGTTVYFSFCRQFMQAQQVTEGRPTQLVPFRSVGT
jgi:light-regulated signal transduction histidine kinase (bacteriophytochrome)